MIHWVRRSRAPLLTTILVAVLMPALCDPARATMPPREGPAPPGLIEAFHQGLFAVGSKPTGPSTQLAVAGNFHIPVILVSFADDDTIRYSPAAFERLLFDTTHAVPTGSVAEYWNWVSGGRVRLTGRVVATVRLPQTQAYYAAGNFGVTSTGTPRNDLGFMRDALQLGQAGTNWNEFDSNFDGYVDMVWMIHAGTGGEGGDHNHLWSITTRMSGGWSLGSAYPTSTLVPGSVTRQVLIDRFTVLPELSLYHAGQQSEIGVFCHEFGHTLGLPDLYNVDDTHNTGPGSWSLMSTGAYGGDGYTPETPTHIGAWPELFLGWAHMIQPTRDTTLALAPIERTPDVVDLWSQGDDSPEHFLIENRRRIDFDQHLPADGLIVYHVNDAMIGFGIANNRINSGFEPGLMLVEGDGDNDLWLGRNRGDANDPFPGALGVTRVDDETTPSLRTFESLRTNIAIQDIALEGEATRMHLQVRPPAWLPADDWTGSGYNPVSARSIARASGHDRDGVEYVVQSEYVGGHAQVVLRTSVAWAQPLVLSSSTASAVDPSLAILPDGDLAVVWSDSRRGRPAIFYRARIRGHWTAEQAVIARTGSCRTPSLATDGRGGLYLAFQYQNGDTLQIWYERFNYAYPVGQLFNVIGAPLRPANPIVCQSADGHGYLVWQDRRPGGQIWFASVSPDSGLRNAQELSGSTAGASAYVATMDSTGALYVLWNVSGPQINDMLLHTRGGGEGPVPNEVLLESLTLPLELMAIDVDASRSIHVAYGLAGPNGVVLRYKRKWPNDTWDAVSTDLSFPGDDPGSQAIVMARRDGNVDIAYTGLKDQQQRFMVRRRRLVPENLLAVPPPPMTVDLTPALWLAPNPVTAGGGIEARAEALAVDTAPILDVFDAAGRRLASLALAGGGGRWQGRVSGALTAGWPGGVYFARVRGANRSTRLVVVR